MADACKGIWDLKEDEVGLLEDILNHADLLEFISCSECMGEELDAGIVDSLTKPELFKNVDEKKKWRFNLRLALQLNRTDFLSEDMFAGVDRDMVPKKFVETSLLEDKRDFLQFLLDSGFPLHKYITPELIVKLYQADVKSNTPEKITMDVVEAVLSKTLGYKLNKCGQEADDESSSETSGE
ncbi:unnamed protein product [Dibothriocephalus latus]|uniref:Uncharacterized protein n=1 Tax=Dibothriocephalus latus TaxID=60516 RepID=A0A3P7LK84_DIBLA|nr:unnamed protein product [Dibothriocephalus latus]